jgi:putative protease
MSNKIELLAPAGDFEKMKYAFAYGADAVYAGVPKFSLRARENDFTDGMLADAVEYAHSLGKKIYLTLNIFPHNRKIEPFRKALERMNEIRPDALILSDPGVIMMAKEICPDVPVHLSTQANTVNWATVEFWRRLGVERIILSRELSLKEISEMRENVPGIELEAFVHGAICIAYSGRCLLSNYFNHRDPNQGTCTNSCRWEYKVYEEKKNEQEYLPIAGEYYLEETERPGQFLPIDEDEHGTYIMNSKDMCAIELLDQMRDAGIDSFKIEGRTKSVYYLSIITRAYRRAIDDMAAGKPLSPDLLDEVLTVANRGYITGFLDRNPREYGENYKDGNPVMRTHLFCGILGEERDASGRIRMAVRNRFELGQNMELVTPEGTFPFVLEEMVDERGASVDIAHGGGKDVFIRIPFDIPPYALVRRPVEQQVGMRITR